MCHPTTTRSPPMRHVSTSCHPWQQTSSDHPRTPPSTSERPIFLQTRPTPAAHPTPAHPHTPPVPVPSSHLILPRLILTSHPPGPSSLHPPDPIPAVGVAMAVDCTQSVWTCPVTDSAGHQTNRSNCDETMEHGLPTKILFLVVLEDPKGAAVESRASCVGARGGRPGVW